MRVLAMFALLFLSTCLASTAAADVVYVDCNAPGPEHDGTSWDTAFLTIQEGVDAATPYGDVWVADGTYVENVVMGEGVAIYGGFLGAEEGGYEDSLDERDYVNNVATIDGNQSGSCVVMAVDTTVDGFTITNGSGTLAYGRKYRGGGIYCDGLGKSGAILNNTITGNVLGDSDDGGGISLVGSSPTVSSNTIANNVCDGYGGGIYCSGSVAAISDNWILGNCSGYDGGGICCESTSPTIARNVIAGNETLRKSGGGIYCGSHSPTITDNVISGNCAAGGAGIYCYSAYPTIVGNDIVDNLGAGLCYSIPSNPVVDGNRIYGNASYGIRCSASGWSAITNNVISDNGGSGLYCNSSSPVVTGNTIVGNSSEYGGGICVFGTKSAPEVTANVIAANSAQCGGGICCERSSPTLTNNFIGQNSAEVWGGGIHCKESASPTVTNNTLAGNLAPAGRGLACDSENQQGPSEVQITNCILWDGGEEVQNNDGSTVAITYSDVWGGWPDEGNICADPLFVDIENGDFHLSPGSPCIDRGDNGAPGMPRVDFEGDFRAVDGDGDEIPVVDIGADEFAAGHNVVTIIDLPETDVTIDEEEKVKFAGTAYHTGGLAMVDWLWDFGEGSGIPDKHVPDPGWVKFGEAGVFTVSFDAQAEDGSWCPVPDTRTITVIAIAPQAVIDSPESDVEIVAGDSVEFAGTANDANGNIVDWLWTFGEGSGIPDMHVEDPGSVQFNNAGEFLVTFNAMDNDGHWDPDPDTRLIRVRGGRELVYVDRDSPGPGHDGNSWDTAFLTIQDGVLAAAPNGAAWVADGTYAENVVMDEGVALYGGFLGAEDGGYEDFLDQRDFANNITTIDGNQSGSCVVMAAEATVDGFTITNGSGTVEDGVTYGGGICCMDIGDTGVIVNNTITGNTARGGAGVYCRYSSPAVTDNRIAENSSFGEKCAGGGVYASLESSPTIAGNFIASNSSEQYGGGVCSAYDASPVISDNIITENAGAFGGGICCWLSPAVVARNVVSNNSGIYGGGLFCSDSTPAVTFNDISRNSAGWGGGVCWFVIQCGKGPSATAASNTISFNTASTCGGGVYCYESSPAMTNNTITRNSSLMGGGISCEGNSAATLANNVVSDNSAGSDGGGIYCDHSSPVLLHNDFWGNTPFDYYGCDPGEGDISADPVFADAEKGDFHLLAGSPCVDAGTNGAPGLPEFDWDGEDRIINGIVDIGADEFFTYYTEAPDPQPECDGALFGEPHCGFPGWVWFSIPLTPAESGDPNDVLGFGCNGRLHRYDKYVKGPQAYQPPFMDWELSVGDSFLVYIESEAPNPAYDGLSPYTPWEFEFKLGRRGWTWIGMPGWAELDGGDFLDCVRVEYPSDDDATSRTAREDLYAIPDNWVTWTWPFWNTWHQAAEYFQPYAPFGHTTCYPWVGYRVWVNVGAAADEDDPDQVTLIWPKPGG